MKQCKYCAKDIPNSKVFCDSECREAYNNATKYTKTTCDYCDKEYMMESRFYRKWLKGERKTKCCSIECHNRLIGKTALATDNKKTGEYKTCPQCNTKFYVKPYLLEQKIYCCRKCKDLASIITFKCDICGEEAKDVKSHYELCKHHFCCRECKDYYMNEIYPKTDEGKQHIQRISILGYQAQLDNILDMNKPELKVYEYLSSIYDTVLPQHYMHDKFFVDFYIPSIDAVVEVFGDYWHGNVNVFPTPTDKQITQIKKDKSRISYLSKTHNKVVILWETDIQNNNYTKICQKELS